MIFSSIQHGYFLNHNVPILCSHCNCLPFFRSKDTRLSLFQLPNIQLTLKTKNSKDILKFMEKISSEKPIC